MLCLTHGHTAGRGQYLLLELGQPSRPLLLGVGAVGVGGALLAAVAALCAFAHHWGCRGRWRRGLCRLIGHFCKPHLKDILQKKGGKLVTKGALAANSSLWSLKYIRGRVFVHHK